MYVAMPLAHLHATEQMAAERRTRNHFVTGALLLAAMYSFLGCQHGKAATSENKPGELATIHLEAFVVNLADNDGRSYLRLGIDLGVEHETPKERDEQRSGTVPVMRDSIISMLSTLRSDELMTPDGKRKLKLDLIKVLNDRLPELKVREIYFNEFMVQR
jgi:flagellar FliL protein